jgi:hypothetical protein
MLCCIHSSGDTFDHSGLSAITKQAGDLINMICSTSDDYSFDYPFFDMNDPEEQRLLRKFLMEDWKFVDVATGQALGSSAGIVWDDNDIAGELLCPVFPGLRRRSKDGTSKLVAKGTILVAFNKPIERTMSK